tara:strand:+ start:1776 stop:1994 length:219 start_codon:yes stop_codon:yes gene_type:complete
MFLQNKRLQISIVLYLIIIGILIFINPNFLYDKNGKMKILGVGDDKTLLPLWLIIFVIAVLCYYIAEIIVNV